MKLNEIGLTFVVSYKCSKKLPGKPTGEVIAQSEMKLIWEIKKKETKCNWNEQ